MFRTSVKGILAISAATMAAFAATTPSIGVAISSGSIRINEAMTAGNANVFNGTTLETVRSTQVRLNDGGELQFGGLSKAQLFSDHIDLQQGSARVSGTSANANGLRIRPESNSSANIEVRGKVVQVAAVTGNVHVFNAKGVNVANLAPGRALNLTPQDAGAMAPTSMTGCATKTGDVVVLTDETSNVMVQLRGGNIRAGRRIQVTGTTVTNATAMGGATQVIAVTNVKEVGGSCKSMAGAAGAAAGAGAGAAGAAAGAAAAGISATTAVVAGVAAAAVAATAGVVAATNGSSGSGTSGSPVVCPNGVSATSCN